MFFSHHTIEYLYNQPDIPAKTLEIKEAIQKAKNNDQKAFKFLLDSYWDYVFGYQIKRTGNENEAEDITIQAFSKAFDKIHTFDDSYSFQTWIITISKNIHIDLVRKEKKHQSQTISNDEEDAYYDILDESPSAEDQLIIEQNLAKLLKDIKKLKPHYQEIINLRYFQELSYQEISDELNEPINNVKVKLLRAKKLLAEIIRKK